MESMDHLGRKASQAVSLIPRSPSTSIHVSTAMLMVIGMGSSPLDPAPLGSGLVVVDEGRVPMLGLVFGFGLSTPPAARDPDERWRFATLARFKVSRVHLSRLVGLCWLRLSGSRGRLRRRRSSFPFIHFLAGSFCAKLASSPTRPRSTRRKTRKLADARVARACQDRAVRRPATACPRVLRPMPPVSRYT